MKERDTALDIIRILACLMVVLMHSPLPLPNANGPFLAALSYFTAPCIGLFFMVSGALLLPVKADYFSFLIKRFGKVIIPTIIWSLIYITLSRYCTESEINILQAIASIPFSPQGEGVLWFMYTLCGLYLIAPILSGWLDRASKKEIQFVLILWGITLCYPVFKLCLLINESNTGPLYYFGGYAGYFLLGYYLRRYPGDIKIALICGIIAMACTILLFVTRRAGIALDFYSLFWYLSIFVAALCICLWITICNIFKSISLCDSIERRISLVSNLSFGVYLIHILVMRYWLWHQFWIINIKNYILQTIVITAITAVVSLILCLIVAKAPKGDYLIGFKIKK